MPPSFYECKNLMLQIGPLTIPHITEMLNEVFNFEGYVHVRDAMRVSWRYALDTDKLYSLLLFIIYYLLFIFIYFIYLFILLYIFFL